MGLKVARTESVPLWEINENARNSNINVNIL